LPLKKEKNPACYNRSPNARAQSIVKYRRADADLLPSLSLRSWCKLAQGVYLNLRAFSSYIPLILLTLVFTLTFAVLELHHFKVSRESELLWSVLRQLFIACWVHLDRRVHHLSLPYEFDAFVFFAWPVTLPYYLYKSRGIRGLFLAALIFALLLLPDLVSAVISVSIRVGYLG
jgi:hypothetical protein